MALDKKSLKLLKRIYKKRRIRYYKMQKYLKKHPTFEEIFHSSAFAPYIELRDVIHPTQKDANGFPIGKNDYSEAYYVTTMLGNIEVEQSKWFTLPFIVSSFIVPIVVGVLGSVITAIVLSLL